MLGNLFQTIGSILLIGSYIPQIVKLIRTRKADGISLLFWMVLTTGLACISINMSLSNVPNLILVTQVLNTLVAFVTTVLVKLYQK